MPSSFAREITAALRSTGKLTFTIKVHRQRINEVRDLITTQRVCTVLRDDRIEVDEVRDMGTFSNLGEFRLLQVHVLDGYNNRTSTMLYENNIADFERQLQPALGDPSQRTMITQVTIRLEHEFAEMGKFQHVIWSRPKGSEVQTEHRLVFRGWFAENAGTYTLEQAFYGSLSGIRISSDSRPERSQTLLPPVGHRMYGVYPLDRDGSIYHLFARLFPAWNLYGTDADWTVLRDDYLEPLIFYHAWLEANPGDGDTDVGSDDSDYEDAEAPPGDPFPTLREEAMAAAEAAPPIATVNFSDLAWRPVGPDSAYGHALVPDNVRVVSSHRAVTADGTTRDCDPARDGISFEEFAGGDHIINRNGTTTCYTAENAKRWQDTGGPDPLTRQPWGGGWQ
jgi:hypothetical protein